MLGKVVSLYRQSVGVDRNEPGRLAQRIAQRVWWWLLLQAAMFVLGDAFALPLEVARFGVEVELVEASQRDWVGGAVI